MPIAESRKLIDDLGGAEAVCLIMGVNVRTIYLYKAVGIPLSQVDEMKRLALTHGVPCRPAFDRSDGQGGDLRSRKYKESKHGKTQQEE